MLEELQPDNKCAGCGGCSMKQMSEQ